ncbi:putative ribonuclease H-like domain-containing protein [Tanacetum coccineum]
MVSENERYKTSEGYHAVPPPYTGNFMPPKYDLVLANEGEYIFSESVTSIPDVAIREAKTSMSKLKSVGEPLIEDWISDNGDENDTYLEEIIYSDDDEEVGAEVVNMNNLATNVLVSPIPTIRVHKDHSLEQIIGDIHLAPQTRRMTKNVSEHEAMQDELLQFKLQKVWTLVDLPYGKRAIGTKWVYKNKKDDRGIVVRNKVRLVAQGYTQEEGINYDKVFSPIARIEAIRNSTTRRLSNSCAKGFDFMAIVKANNYANSTMKQNNVAAMQNDVDSVIGSGPKCQHTILGGVEAQIRFEAASKQSNDPPLSRVNTLGSVRTARTNGINGILYQTVGVSKLMLLSLNLLPPVLVYAARHSLTAVRDMSARSLYNGEDAESNINAIPRRHNLLLLYS